MAETLPRPTASDEYRCRILALDWHDLPAGHYALPVYEYAEDEQTEPVLLGYRTFRRTAPRTTSTGHHLGRDTFTTGATYAAPGIDPARLAAEIRQQQADHTAWYGPRGYVQNALDDLLIDTRHRDTYRATFGRITGRCGRCGRRLTDPTSKLAGIGPECRKGA